MSFYNVNNFFYDETTNNIIIQFTREVEVEYDYVSETGPAYEVLETQVFLDGSTNLVGKHYPASVDGTVVEHVEGRNLGQTPDVIPDIPLP